MSHLIFELRIDAIISCSVEIEGELSEAEGYLRAMEVEFRTMASGEKRSAQQKVSEYKEEFRQLQQHFQTSKFNAESIALKGGPESRTKLLNANQRLDNSTATLEQTKVLLNETHQIGDAIISDMENQKEKLIDSREKVKETKQYTTDAKRILRMMGNRAIMHKCFVMFLIVALLGGICGVGYWMMNK